MLRGEGRGGWRRRVLYVCGDDHPTISLRYNRMKRGRRGEERRGEERRGEERRGGEEIIACGDNDSETTTPRPTATPRCNRVRREGEEVKGRQN